MFCASEFADVSSAWGITFNIWNSGKSIDKNSFVHKLCKNENDEISEFGTKKLSNFDDKDVCTVNDFVQRPFAGMKKINSSQLICIDIKSFTFAKKDIKTYINHICSIDIYGNDVQNNGTCSIRNVAPSAHSIPLTYDNIFESCIVYSIRTLTEGSWINDKDMYDMNVDISDEFRNDAFVHSMFANYCCGIKVDADRLYNEFFWCNPKDIAEWANDCNNDEVYNDANTMLESFVYKKLQAITLSAEAQAVLDKANELLKKSMKYRKLFNDEHPQYQILNADQGWYCIKAMLKEYMPDELKEFKEIYKKLADKMRPMIYTLGFLRK